MDDRGVRGASGPGRHLLVRRALVPDAEGELESALFLCSAPVGTTLAELAAVAGAWYRHSTLSVLTCAFLAVSAAANHTPGSGGTAKKGIP